MQLLHSVNMLRILLAPFLEGFGLTTCREQPGLPAFKTCETKHLKSSATMVRKKLTLTETEMPGGGGTAGAPAREAAEFQFRAMLCNRNFRRHVTEGGLVEPFKVTERLFHSKPLVQEKNT